jgi:ubiquinone/menaquinone biosynthesis C-methylase UbiE
MLLTIAHRLMRIPIVFQLQQRICNNYANIGAAYSSYLTGNGKTVLDIGCSTAECAGQIIDMKRNKYIGVDIESRYIELARKRHPLGQFLCHDARELPFEPDSFDIVLFNGVWHHMSDQLVTSCLQEVRRVVKNSGVILVSEPIFRFDWLVSTWFLNRDRGKFIRTREGYRSLFDGFDVIEEKILRLSIHEFCGFVAKKRH